jgi:hypothetical protein
MSLPKCSLPQLLLLLLLLVAVAAPAAAADDCLSIIGFSGCSWSSCGVVHNCVGGDLLTITGSHFDRLQGAGDWEVQLDNRYDCSNASLTVDNRVVCSLPHVDTRFTYRGHSQVVVILNSTTGLSLLCAGNALGVLYAVGGDDVRSSATGVTGAAASCSWSSAAPWSIPVVASVTGCNPKDAKGTTNCDGSGQATLTIRGESFLPSPITVIVQGARAAYSCSPISTYEQTIQCSGLRVDASDLNISLPLYVSNGLGYWSDQPIMLSFSSSGGSGGGGGGGDSGGSGGSGGGGGDGGSSVVLSSLWLIVLGCVLGVVIVGVLILCALSRYCGVSLWRCCRGEQESSQPLLASQGVRTEGVV